MNTRLLTLLFIYFISFISATYSIQLKKEGEHCNRIIEENPRNKPVGPPTPAPAPVPAPKPVPVPPTPGPKIKKLDNHEEEDDSGDSNRKQSGGAGQHDTIELVEQ